MRRATKTTGLCRCARVWLALVLFALGSALADAREALADQTDAIAASTPAADACCAGSASSFDPAECASSPCPAGCPALLPDSTGPAARAPAPFGCALDLRARGRVAVLEPHPPRFFSEPL